MYLNLDNIDDEVTELIANEILQGSQEDDGSTAGVRRSRQGLAALRSLALISRKGYDAYRPHLIKDLTISNNELYAFLILLQRDPEAFKEIQHLAFSETTASSSSSSSKPTSSKYSKGSETREMIEAKLKKEKDNDIETARLISTLGFEELKPDESLEKKNLTTAKKRSESQKIALRYLHVGRSLLIDGLESVKSLEVNDLEKFGFSFIKRTTLIKETIKPPVLDEDVMGMGMKNRGNTIEREEVPTTIPLGGLSSISKLNLNSSSSDLPSSTTSRNLTMTNATWILTFLPNLQEVNLGITLDKLDSDMINESFKGSKELAGVSKVKVLELDCHVLSRFKIPITDFVPDPSSTNDSTSSPKVTQTDSFEGLGQIKPEFLSWTNDSEKSLAIKNFLSLTKNLTKFYLNISHAPIELTPEETKKNEKKSTSEPSISIETIRKGITSSFSTLKSLSLKNIHFPTKSELDPSSQKSKTKFKSPFVSFLSLEELSLDYKGLKSLEPQVNYPDQTILTYFPPKLRSLEILVNVGFGFENEDEIENLVSGNGVVEKSQVEVKVNGSGSVDEEGEGEGKGNETQSASKSGKKKKKKKSNATATITNGPTTTTETPSSTPSSATKIKTPSSSDQSQSLLQTQQHYFLESKISSFLLVQSQIQSSDSLALPKNFKTLITPYQPISSSDKHNVFLKPKPSSKDGDEVFSFDLWKYTEDLKEAEKKRKNEMIKAKTLGQIENEAKPAREMRENFRRSFEENRMQVRKKLEKVNGGMSLVCRK